METRNRRLFSQMMFIIIQLLQLYCRREMINDFYGKDFVTITEGQYYKVKLQDCPKIPKSQDQSAEQKDSLYNEKKEPKSLRKLSYNWNDIENRRYITFLMKKGSLFDLSLTQKMKKGVNVQMSKIVKTRNSTQCRCHHQKMMVRYGSISAIIENNQYLLSLNRKCQLFKQRSFKLLQNVHQEQKTQNIENWQTYLNI